jgi:hypothetical protein
LTPLLPGAYRLPAALAVAALAAAGAARADTAATELAAVRQVFPETERVDSRDVLLTPEMVAAVERLARARVKERMVTFYTALAGSRVLGHAVIHSHIVRTKRETFVIGFEPDGRIRKILVVAFLEPPEYRPTERWLEQFQGKGTKDRLTVGDDIAPISGATLTARGIAEQSRWLLQALQLAGVASEVRR